MYSDNEGSEPQQLIIHGSQSYYALYDKINGLFDVSYNTISAVTNALLKNTLCCLLNETQIQKTHDILMAGVIAIGHLCREGFPIAMTILSTLLGGLFIAETLTSWTQWHNTLVILIPTLALGAFQQGVSVHFGMTAPILMRLCGYAVLENDHPWLLPRQGKKQITLNNTPHYVGVERWWQLAGVHVMSVFTFIAVSAFGISGAQEFWHFIGIDSEMTDNISIAIGLIGGLAQYPLLMTGVRKLLYYTTRQVAAFLSNRALWNKALNALICLGFAAASWLVICTFAGSSWDLWNTILSKAGVTESLISQLWNATEAGAWSEISAVLLAIIKVGFTGVLCPASYIALFATGFLYICGDLANKLYPKEGFKQGMKNCVPYFPYVMCLMLVGFVGYTATPMASAQTINNLSGMFFGDESIWTRLATAITFAIGETVSMGLNLHMLNQSFNQATNPDMPHSVIMAAQSSLYAGGVGASVGGVLGLLKGYQSNGALGALGGTIAGGIGGSFASAILGIMVGAGLGLPFMRKFLDAILKRFVGKMEDKRIGSDAEIYNDA